jgi:hypothetical protein
MEELIRQVFLNVDIFGELVDEGRYDLIGPNGEIILPQAWEATIEPGWSISMQMWPSTDARPALRFGQSHSRRLVTYQCNITALDIQIQNLDKDNNEGRSDIQFQPKTRDYDTEKRGLLEKLKKELLAYSIVL